MKRNCLLVHLPAIPFGAEDLLPQPALALGASALRSTGHSVRIADYGTLGQLQRIATPALRSQARRLVDFTDEAVLWDPSAPELARRETAQLRTLLESAREQRNEGLAAAVRQEQNLDLIAFLARNAADAAECVAATARIRNCCPHIKLALFGPFAEQYSGIILDAIPAMDVVIHGEVEISLPEWASYCDDPSTWHKIPGLVFRNGTELFETPYIYVDELAGLTENDFEELASSHAQTEKLQIYTIELSRGMAHRGYNHPSHGDVEVRTKDPKTLNSEIMAAHKATGTRALHFAGRSASVASQECLAVLLTTHPADILYSRTASISGFDPSRMPLLVSSGCCAVDFQIDSGSQRLLEDFYGNDFGISPMERVLRAIRSTGCYTALHFTFPCPEDDRHTAAETLRILQRNRPNAISIRAPQLVPGSPWCARAPEFGFRISHRRYARWAKSMLLGESGARRSLKFGLAAAQLELSYRMRGWAEEDAAAARTALFHSARSLGVAPKGSAVLGLIARLAGCTGQEGEFLMALERALFTFDSETARVMIERINATALLPQNTYVLRPFQPTLAAVAN